VEVTKNSVKNCLHKDHMMFVLLTGSPESPT